MGCRFKQLRFHSLGCWAAICSSLSFIKFFQKEERQNYFALVQLQSIISISLLGTRASRDYIFSLQLKDMKGILLGKKPEVRRTHLYPSGLFHLPADFYNHFEI